MTNVNTFYTQQASTSSAASEGTKGAGAITGGKKGAAGLFDMLMAAMMSTTQPTAPTAPATATDEAATDPSLATPVVDVATPVDTKTGLDDSLTATDATPMTNVLAVVTADIKDGDVNVTVTTPDETAEAMPIKAPPGAGIKPDTSLPSPLQAQLSATAPGVSDDLQTAADSLATSPDAGDDALMAKTTVTTPTGPAADTAEPNGDIAAQLNAMTIGGDDKAKDEKTNKSTDVLSALTKGVENAQDAYKPVINATNAGYTPSTATTTGTAFHAATNTSSSPSVIISASDKAADDMASWSDPLATSTTPTIAPTTASTVAARTASVTAPQAHAAVQAVAMHLQSLGQNRETKSLTLQLNPAELGKMQIKMTFGRDKSVKTDILVEKSDTFNMMQRDQDTLKDALVQAGLNADAGSLNFSLADQGTFAHANDNGSGSGMARANDNGDTIAAYEIKSSEEWTVDPSTGITRYNIWV